MEGAPDVGMAVRQGVNRRWDVALIGDSFIDHVFTGFPRWPRPGEESFARNYVREAGGGAVNTACALAKLGRTAALVTVVGREDGDWLVGRVANFGVDTSAVRRSDLYTGLTAAVSFPSERAFFTYVGASGELPGLLRDPLVLEQLQQSRHVHFAFEPERESAIAAFEKLREAGCGVSLDLGWHEEWLRDPSTLDLIRLTTLFLPNEIEAQAMTGETDPRAMLESFERSGVASVAIKLGEKGAIMSQAGEFYECGGFTTEAVDTTGAGDAFDAGLIHAILNHAAPKQCLETACLVGALSTRAAGALNALPTRQELEARL